MRNATGRAHPAVSATDLPEAVEVYRRVLAAQPDHSVTIVTVGYLTNLAHLLAAPAAYWMLKLMAHVA